MRYFWILLCLLGFNSCVSYGAPNAKFPLTPNCDPITGCPAVIAATKYQSHPAFIFNNGVTAATVVLELGRVMSFGLSKSTFNWLWNNQSPHKNQSWQNWGGSKSWLAPQSDWQQIVGAKWPPDPNWTKVVKSEVQTGGFLQTTGAVSPHSGIRFINEYGHDETGNFFIRQTAKKVSGKPLRMALWSVTQIAPPDAVFFVVKPKSTFKTSTLQLQGSASPHLVQKGDLACYIPGKQPSAKLGIDAAIPALAALRDNQLFVLRAKPQNAVYPDAVPPFLKGFPIEIFDSGVMPQRYLELEFYSPLREIYQGSAWTFTVTWNIYNISAPDLESPQLWKQIAEILKT